MTSSHIQLNHLRLKQAFESLGYSQLDYISSYNLQKSLDTLNNGQFDRDVFEQLWEQCKLNSQSQTKISTFIDNIIRAQVILIQKQNQTSEALKKIHDKMSGGEIQNAEKLEFHAQYNQLTELREGFAIDLEIIRKPFYKFIADTTVRTNNREVKSGYNNPFPADVQSSQYDPLFGVMPIPVANKQNLAWIFYLAFFGILGEVIVYLYLNAFMNSVLFLLILSMYFFEHFDRLTIRFFFWFSIFTLIVDIVWYVIAAKNVWATHDVCMWPKFLNGYLKLSVVLISCVFILKVFIVVLLLSEYNIDESQPQEVNICGFIFVLKSEGNDGPLKNGLGNIKNERNENMADN